MIFDGHSDTWADVTIRRLNGEKDVFRRIHLDNFKRANIEGAIFVIWIDPPYDKEPEKRVKQIISSIKDEIEDMKDVVNIVKKYSDIDKGIRENKINILIGLEGLSHIGRNIDLLDYFYKEVGARHASLTWNEQNELATGCLGDENRGLTEIGKKAVNKMEKLGMVVDVSHLNEKSFWDLMSIASKPVIASHSNARSLCDAKRNLTDNQLKEISNTGGLVGINSFRGFTNSNPKKQDLIHLVDHIDYMVNLIGIEHVSFGFDFSDYLGKETIGSFTGNASMPSVDGLESTHTAHNIVVELENRGYKKKDIDLISSGNFYRLFGDILK
ncbi:dipeptidase [Clostridioides difficile]|uniref:dipeptidase n=1 Tax=Clostridioides difficile TaxID=1496 RepID=UPI0021D0A41C|nr:dipeptidase [Clostridioides difficile]MCU5871557.1 membrane dipeptidase [Clostridioides difficile]MCU5897881.1 membrane dipeptidase [Clostridioides difficile]